MTKEIPLINTNLVALVDDEDFKWLSGFKWYPFRKRRRGKILIYAGRNVSVIGQDGKRRSRGREMQRDLLDPDWKSSRSIKSDHRNHDTLDNRKENLRLATNSQSNMNRRYSEAEGRRGVRFETKKGAYRATIKVNERRYNSRFFSSLEEAARAYNWLALKHHGEFARLNLDKDGRPLEPIPPNPRKKQEVV